MQYDLEMAAQDLASKKQQCEELATGVSVFPFRSLELLWQALCGISCNCNTQDTYSFYKGIILGQVGNSLGCDLDIKTHKL